jgi:hypothetical protein
MERRGESEVNKMEMGCKSGSGRIVAHKPVEEVEVEAEEETRPSL